MHGSKRGNEAYDLRNLKLGPITVNKIRSCSACQGSTGHTSMHFTRNGDICYSFS